MDIEKLIEQLNGYFEGEMSLLRIPWHQNTPESPVRPRYNPRYSSGQNRPGTL